MAAKKEDLLLPILYTKMPLEKVFSEYESVLRTQNTIREYEHANVIHAYARMYDVWKEDMDSNYSENEFKILYNDFCKYLFERYGSKVRVKLRLKSFIKFEEKIRSYIKKNKSFNELRDLIGFRVIADVSIQELYQMIDSISLFFTSQHYCTLTKANVSTKHSELVNSSQRYAIKDYVYDPKSNGYQSIQFGLWSYEMNTFFEIQLRTEEMDEFAEKADDSRVTYSHSTEQNNDADHDNYKKKKYEDLIIVDWESVKISGFRTRCEKNEVRFTDNCGLLKAFIYQSI